MKCPLCLSTKLADLGRVRFDIPKYYRNPHLFECKNCLMFFIYPKANEKNLSKIYSGTYHYLKNNLLDRFVSLYNSKDLASDSYLVIRHIKEGKILDIGAGRGDFISRFRGDKWEKWAFDPYLSDKGTKRLKKKIGARVNDFSSLSLYPRNYFDVVTLRNVIEHTYRFMPLLSQIKGILKKGGVLFIRTPNINSIEFELFKNNWYVIRMAGHLVFFGKKSINRALKVAGFKRFQITNSRVAAPLSLYRSVDHKLPKALIAISSIIFSALSFFGREGTDLMVIARK